MDYDLDMQTARLSYRSLVISRIPIWRDGTGFCADTMWALDINANAETIDHVRLVCPIQAGGGSGRTPLDPRIEVIDSSSLTTNGLEKLVAASDIVEVSGNQDWPRSALARRAVRLARKNDKLSVLGISSNRIRTTLMNAAGRPLPSRTRAWLKAQSIRLSQRHLASRCDAVRVIGMGLRPLVEGLAKTIRVETASWISQKDILPPRDGQSDPVSIVIASRLEPMKGVAIGVKAVAGLSAAGQGIVLNVIGRGAEEGRLKQQVKAQGIDAFTRFPGQLDYPGPFFAALRNADYVLLTNLNDEQPRLIFDAIAQGAIPVCPRHHAYEELKLDPRLLYTQGSADDLMETLQRLIELPEDARRAIRMASIELARNRTLESMHARRRDWVLSLLQGRDAERYSHSHSHRGGGAEQRTAVK